MLSQCHAFPLPEPNHSTRAAPTAAIASPPWTTFLTTAPLDGAGAAVVDPVELVPPVEEDPVLELEPVEVLLPVMLLALLLADPLEALIVVLIALLAMLEAMLFAEVMLAPALLAPDIDSTVLVLSITNCGV